MRERLQQKIALAVGRLGIPILFLAGCGASQERTANEQLADYGEVSLSGGCAASTPSVRLDGLDWLRMSAGISRSLAPNAPREERAIFFIAMYKHYAFWRWSESPQQATARLARTTAHITASSPHITVKTADGVARIFEVPEFRQGFEVTGSSKVISVPLDGLKPPNFLVVIPDLFVDGVRVPAGTIRFTYQDRDAVGVC